jgi:hypothetical protein
MAGGDKGSKLPDSRRSRAAITLPARNPAKAPALPKGPPPGGWPDASKTAWKSWWSDPVSMLWQPGEVELVRQLVFLHASIERQPSAAQLSEFRLRVDQLGLSAKGRRDMGIKVDQDGATTVQSPRGDTPYAGLRVVDGGSA